MKYEEEDGIRLAPCSKRGGVMIAWWRWSGNLKGREKCDDLTPHGEERWKKNPDKRGGPAGRKSGTQHKKGLIGERKLQPYASHGVEN